MNRTFVLKPLHSALESSSTVLMNILLKILDTTLCYLFLQLCYCGAFWDWIFPLFSPPVLGIRPPSIFMISYWGRYALKGRLFSTSPSCAFALGGHVCETLRSMRAHAHAYTVCTHTPTHAHKQACAHTHTHTHTHAHTHMHRFQLCCVYSCGHSSLTCACIPI